ncbi:hypothetical protein QY889_09715 [Latilactobacillus sakei]
MYKRYFFTFLLGGSLFLLFTPIRAEAVPATSSATIQFSNQQTLPVVPLPRPPLIAAPDNAGQWHMTPLEYVPPLTQRLSQTKHYRYTLLSTYRIAPIINYYSTH